MQRVVVGLLAVALLGVRRRRRGRRAGGDTRARVSTAVPASPTTATTAAAARRRCPPARRPSTPCSTGGGPAIGPALLVASAPAVDALFAIAPETGQAGLQRRRGQRQRQLRVPTRRRRAPGAGRPTADGAGFLVDFVILGS